MTSRDVILGRIRNALTDVPPLAPENDVAIAWRYGQRPEGVPEDILSLFVERVEDYRAVVWRINPTDVPRKIGKLLAGHGARSVVIPSGADDSWRVAVQDLGIRVVQDDPPLTHAEMDAIDAVVTDATVGIAVTGTIVLDHGAGQGRRALSLVPDLHVCVVRAEQVVADVPEAITLLQASIEERRPQTWISGPSATSDIELSRVEGVHGPRTLHVLLVNV